MILVTGGTGYVGQFLLDALAQGNAQVRCVVRPGKPKSALERLRRYGMEICEGDLLDSTVLNAALRDVRCVLHLAHIRFAPNVLRAAPDSVERLVLMSSLWRFSRVPSPVVDEVIKAEREVEQSNKPWVLLRPSMIYGPGDDRNINRLRAHLNRWSVMPIFGSGRALQQPVFVGDVVAATIASMHAAGIERRAYAIAGAQAVTYRVLLKMLGASMGVTPRIVSLPARPLAALLGAVRRCGIHLPVDPEQILRLQEDKQYNISAARADLAFDPLTFEAGLEKVEQCGRDGA